MSDISPVKDTDSSFEIQVKEARRRALEFQEYMKNSTISCNDSDDGDVKTTNLNTSLNNSQLVNLITENEESHRERAARHSLLKDDTEVMEKNSILRVQNLQLQDEVQRMRNVAQENENAVHVRIREMENIATERDLWRARENALRRQLDMVQQELEVTRKAGSGNTSPSMSSKSLSPNSTPRHSYTHVNYNSQQSPSQQFRREDKEVFDVNVDHVNGLLIGDGGEVPPAPPPTRVSSRADMLTSHDSLSNSGHGVNTNFRIPTPVDQVVMTSIAEGQRINSIRSQHQQNLAVMNDSDTDPGLESLESLENEIDALIPGKEGEEEGEGEESALSKSILDLPVPGMNMDIDMLNASTKAHISGGSSSKKSDKKSLKKIRSSGPVPVISENTSIRKNIGSATTTTESTTTNPYEVVLSPNHSPLPIRPSLNTTSSSPSRITAKDVRTYTSMASSSSSSLEATPLELPYPDKPQSTQSQSPLSFKSVSGAGVIDNPRFVPSSRGGLSAESFLKRHQDLMHKQAIRKAEFHARLEDDELRKVREEAESMKRQADKRQKRLKMKESKKKQAKEVKKLVESLSPKKAYVSPAKANPGIPSLREMEQSKEYNKLKSKGPGTSPAMRRYYSKVKPKVDTSLQRSRGENNEITGSALNSSYNAFAKLTMTSAAKNVAAVAMNSRNFPLPLPLPPSHDAGHNYLHGYSQSSYDMYEDEEGEDEEGVPYSSSAMEEINSSFYSNNNNSDDEDDDDDDEDENLDGLNIVVNDKDNERYIRIKSRIPSTSSGKKTKKIKGKTNKNKNKTLRKLSSNSFVDGGVGGGTRVKGRKRVATIVRRIERAMGASTDLASSLDSDFRITAPEEHHQMQMNDSIYSFDMSNHKDYATTPGSNSEHEGGMNRSQYLDSIPMQLDYEAHDHDITAGIAQAYYKHKKSLRKSNKKIKRKFDRLQKVVKNLASASGLRVKLVSNKSPTKTSGNTKTKTTTTTATRMKNKNNTKSRGGFVKPPAPPPTIPTKSGTRMQLRTTIAWMEKLKREHDDEYPMNYKMNSDIGSANANGNSIVGKKKNKTNSRTKGTIKSKKK